ncbi:hypothetical protein OO013_15705 [Mangrovivirga sp. M17]|uniref:Uncharacterized protein n=1 Tax=Mangrovivirga halotolerans TaxID=2993936 RepID=A0ABT3RUM8_9BACT|nr:hypothetical protein [Mangrovivirga halotolerans]MCX2745323.1 hypothetical protein [Mangrovivirga halotolerans]
MNQDYILALQRADLSEWLLHLTKGNEDEAYLDLLSILNSFKINSSKHYQITNFDPEGATCFYDVPLGSLKQLIDTNPNKRKGFGIIVAKRIFWYLGGRPVIYTDSVGLNWPLTEKYRLVNTNLDSIPPIDWSHEREWRFKGDFYLYNEILYNNSINWWWPCVENMDYAKDLLFKFQNINSIYIRELNQTIDRNFNVIS